MAPESQPNQGKPRWTGIAIALVVVGLLILVPSGLCTAFVGLPLAFGGFASDSEMMFNILMLGIVPMALGAALVYAGLKSRRRD
jgi:hypothetical protein